MPRDSNGTYTRAAVTPPASSQIASAADMNAELDDIATALTGSLAANGSKTWTGDQAAGGYKITGLGAGSTNGDAVRYEQVSGLMSLSATQRLLGRNTSGAGAVEEVTATQVIDWIGSTRGQVLYRGASAWSVLAPGTSGQVLKTNGAGADPAWVDAVLLAGAQTITGLKTINFNAASAPSALTGTALQLAGADSTGVQIQIDGFAGTPAFIMRRAGGTGASPSAISSGNAIFQLGGRGYGATGYASANRITLNALALENWTDSAQGTCWQFVSTSKGAAGGTERYRMGDFESANEVGYRGLGAGSVPDATYTFALTDAGVATDHTSGSAHTYTVPPQSSVAYPANTVLTGTNWGSGTLTIARGSGVTFRDSSGTDADLTVAQYKTYYCRRHPTSSDTWTVSVS